MAFMKSKTSRSNSVTPFFNLEPLRENNDGLSDCRDEIYDRTSLFKSRKRMV